MKLVTSVLMGLLLLGANGCAELKEVGTVIGHTTRDATKAIGHASRDAVNSIKEDMSDEE
ncbi:hypothetical protein AB4259_17280 [Vibrio amylolyticus]|uniref:hypothetical protein n=1 Tax=Vibrio TaxID=662 RepID=UPI000C839517|nr:hypothetical protein [Vibrio sp. 10N.261.55.A7]PMJ99154.1 hypothetical protein BCU12_00370 [Vibrio sp. 10N.261.55.A7]